MNIVLVSHCGFEGNSALHVYSIARELHRRGHSPLVCVPSEPQLVASLGKPPFPVRSFAEAQAQALAFADGGGPTLIHGFSPREHVRRQVLWLHRRYACPYLVHLEDNEEAIVEDELQDRTYAELAELPTAALRRWIAPWRTHPQHVRSFLSGACGVTALIDRLLEFKPPQVPGTVFWPGFDPGFAQDGPLPIDFRQRLGLSQRDLVLVYTGDVHPSNLAEVRSLYLALGLLRRAGYPALLLKTGWNRVDMGWVEDCGLQDWVINLGYLPRHEVPQLLRAADILVQPGGPNRFNDYRFPSKLPEFLASGRPLVLPHSNIGRFLHDGQQALLLQRGDAMEIHDKVSRLAAAPAWRENLGRAGRQFALRRLSWSDSVERILSLYARACREDPRAAQRRFVQARCQEQRLVPRPKLIAWCGPAPQDGGAKSSQETCVPGGACATRGRVQEPAAAADIHGLCYLHRAVDPDANPVSVPARKPFCHCLDWASNEGADTGRGAARRWGGIGDMAKQWIRQLLPSFGHEQHIRIQDAPLVLIRGGQLLPHLSPMLSRWRRIARQEAGLDLHLVAVGANLVGDPRRLGFDALVKLSSVAGRPTAGASPAPEPDPVWGRLADPDFLPDYPWYPCVEPHWRGNEGGQSRGDAVAQALPSAEQEYLRRLTAQTMARSAVQEPLIFIRPPGTWPKGECSDPTGDRALSWIQAARGALCEGIRTYWAHRGIRLTRAEAEEELRLGNLVYRAFT